MFWNNFSPSIMFYKNVSKWWTFKFKEPKLTNIYSVYWIVPYTEWVTFFVNIFNCRNRRIWISLKIRIILTDVIKFSVRYKHMKTHFYTRYTLILQSSVAPIGHRRETKYATVFFSNSDNFLCIVGRNYIKIVYYIFFVRSIEAMDLARPRSYCISNKLI